MRSRRSGGIGSRETQTRAKRRDQLLQLPQPLREFLRTETGGTGALLTATILALVWANSPWSGAYESLFATEISLSLGDAGLSMDLKHWVNDGLMALFFFIVGLEVRREFSMGALSNRRRAVIPVLAGFGGMIVPALLYLAVNPSGEAANGWGIVIGTDTAFLLGALSLVGPKFSTQLRIFLLTLTVIDDIVAVTIIGVVYSGSIRIVPLAVAGVALLTLVAFNRLGVSGKGAYLLVVVVLWLATLESGLHASIAGMVAGLAIVAHPPRRNELEWAESLFRAFRQSPMPDVQRWAKRGLERAISVNERLQTALHPWASYFVVPLFALANAGIDLRGGVLSEALTSPVTWGVVLGLAGGKLLGIGIGALGGVRLGLGPLPKGVAPGQVLAGGALSGIGFTVSLLIAGLAFTDQSLRDQATAGILLAALISIATGGLLFRAAAVFRGERTADLPMVLNPPVQPDKDHIRGPVDAPLTLVEYGDYQCPFCSRATGVSRELQERFGDELRYVFRHLPLPDRHPDAELAAMAAEAAAAQGRFWEMHDLLFRRQDHLSFEDLVAYAADLGLDLEKFLRDLESEETKARIREYAAGAEASGVQGTPTFFIGNRRHIGPHDAETLAAELEALRGELSLR